MSSACSSVSSSSTAFHKTLVARADRSKPATSAADIDMRAKRSTDAASADTRSAIMSSIRSRDTGLERKVRSALHARGYRFRLHRKDLPGTPDIVFVRHRVAVFVHGCFWHHHARCKNAKLPKSNAAFWKDKLERNRLRDARAVDNLKQLGWRVVTLWECAIKRDLSAQIARVAGALGCR